MVKCGGAAVSLPANLRRSSLFQALFANSEAKWTAPHGVSALTVAAPFVLSFSTLRSSYRREIRPIGRLPVLLHPIRLNGGLAEDARAPNPVGPICATGRHTMGRLGNANA